MKRVIVSLLAATCLNTAALAADLPSRRAPAPYIAPIFTWTGFYIGVNAGYAFNGDSKLKNVNFSNFSDVNYTVIRNSDDGSFTGGAQAGYNYQMGSVVFGIEADINYAAVEKKYFASTDIAGFAGELNAKSEVEWYGTLRPRLGFVPVDRLLVFVTGGLAYGQVKTSATFLDTTGRNVNGSKDDTRVGWTLGAGLEYAITDNVTVKGEYAYVDLGDKNRTWTNGIDFLTVKEETNFHVVRAGLNYKF